MFKVNTIALRKHMIDAGFNSNKELAAAAGAKPNTIGNVVSGRHYPNAYLMYRISKALHLTQEQSGELWFHEEDPVDDIPKTGHENHRTGEDGFHA